MCINLSFKSACFSNNNHLFNRPVNYCCLKCSNICVFARDCHCLVIYACVSQPRGQVYIGTIPADADLYIYIYIFHNGHRFIWNYKFRKHIRLQMKVSITYIVLIIYLPAYFFNLYFLSSKAFICNAVQQWPYLPLSRFLQETKFIDSDQLITNIS